MTSTITYAVCSSCLTLLVPPDSARGSLGRARVVSGRGVLVIVFYLKIIVSDLECPFVRIDTYHSISMSVNMWDCVVKQEYSSLTLCISGRRFKFRSCIFFCVPFFFTFPFVWHHVCVFSQPSSSRTWYIIPGTWYLVCIYVHKECCCRCCCCSVLLCCCCCLCCSSSCAIESGSRVVFYFSSFQRVLFWFTPWP